VIAFDQSYRRALSQLHIALLSREVEGPAL